MILVVKLDLVEGVSRPFPSFRQKIVSVQNYFRADWNLYLSWTAQQRTTQILFLLKRANERLKQRGLITRKYYEGWYKINNFDFTIGKLVCENFLLFEVTTKEKNFFMYN